MDRPKTRQKQTIYIPEDMLREMWREAYRQDRTVSWLIERSWRLAKQTVQKFPAPKAK